MKKLLLFLLLSVFCLNVRAQYVSGAGELRDSSLVVQDNNKVVQNSYKVLQDSYKVAQDWRTAGIVMTAAGGAVGVAGGMTFMLGTFTSVMGATAGAVGGAIVGSVGGKESGQQAAGQAAQNGVKAGKPFITGGLIAAAVGLSTLAAGIPLIVVHNRRMHSIKEQMSVADVAFGPTQGGIGLSVRF
ncbi:MAG: hypothetical protein J6M31_05435 [Bacteroidales bacterium]|nr:hypothetical protein [Bacteroidales bacterium]